MLPSSEAKSRAEEILQRMATARLEKLLSEMVIQTERSILEACADGEFFVSVVVNIDKELRGKYLEALHGAGYIVSFEKNTQFPGVRVNISWGHPST